jgi:hypothetical protein
MLTDRLQRRRFLPQAGKPVRKSSQRRQVCASVLVIAVPIVVAMIAVVIVAVSAIVAALPTVAAVIRYQDAGSQRQHRHKHQNGEFHE